ncbi:MAG: hypothetical protein HC895_12650 [Leptolyngbyaceae cyanobacterium SM1_3_5]|nr:hypothetical protein [Leptolyngbyaceae cyanobacterium SM1_3_5]
MRKAGWLRGHHLDVMLLADRVFASQELRMPVTLLPKDSQPYFASKPAKQKFYNQILFSCIRSLTCHA